MNTKIERINKEIDKTKGRIAEFQAKLRELEKQKTELENLEIIGAVRGMDISIADLAAMIQQTAPTTSGQPGLPTKHSFGGVEVGPKSYTKEDDE